MSKFNKAAHEALLERGDVPNIIKKVIRKRIDRIGDTPYRVVLRRKGDKRGISWTRKATMKEAREVCDNFMRFAEDGTTMIIYVQCPSMPLDARYYVKHEGKVLQSRARTYTKEGKKWLKDFGMRAEYLWHHEGEGRPWSEQFPKDPKPQMYSSKWLEVSKWVKFYMGKEA